MILSRTFNKHGVLEARVRYTDTQHLLVIRNELTKEYGDDFIDEVVLTSVPYEIIFRISNQENTFIEEIIEEEEEEFSIDDLF